MGIETFEDLEAAGTVEAYQLVRAAGFNGTLNLLYALQATLLGIHWQDLPAKERDRLRNAIR